MLEYLTKLLAHEHWANTELLTALQPLPAVPPRTVSLLRHILAAHEFWDKRLRGEPIPRFDFWPQESLEECAALNAKFGESWPRRLRALPAPLEAQQISYTGLNGNPYTFPVVDLLTQLHAHSVHHRAQIMLDMKAAGLEPVNTDYIRFCTLTTAEKV